MTQAQFEEAERRMLSFDAHQHHLAKLAAERKRAVADQFSSLQNR